MGKAKQAANKQKGSIQKVSDHYKAFIDMMVSASVTSLEVLSKTQGIKAKRLAQKDIRPVYGPWQALAMMATNESGIILKVFYREAELKNLLPAKLLNKSGNKLENAVKDLAREYANQTIGIFRNLMADSSDVRASIPIITRGSDEIWYSRASSTTGVEDAWQIEFVGGTITCKINGIDLDEDFYERFKSTVISDHRGGIEFL